MWPGFGENMRVLEWILGRCTGKTKAVESPVGYMPTPSDLNLEGLDIDPAVMKALLTIEPADWKAEVENQGEFFGKFENVPAAIQKEYAGLRKRLGDVGTAVASELVAIVTATATTIWPAAVPQGIAAGFFLVASCDRIVRGKRRTGP